ncbi:MAG: hypothetical protein AAGD38_23525 [Acidobacteriota bacterium]
MTMTTHDAQPTLHLEVEARIGRQGGWYLHLAPEWLRLIARDTDESVVVTRAEVAQRLMLRGSLLAVELDQGRAVFELGDARQVEQVSTWIGPPTTDDLRVAQQRRLRWGIPIGLLILVSALPVAGDASTKVQAEAFDPWAAVLGTVLIGLALVVRWRPHRQLFLVEAAWFIGLTVFAAHRLLAIGSLWWILPVIAGLAGAWGSVETYFGFARVVSATPGDPVSPPERSDPSP